MRTITYHGLLALRPNFEADDILFISSVEDPLAEELHEQIDGKQVSVRYWITDRESSKDELVEETIKMVSGLSEARLVHQYSDITGYLWTEEDLMIGGHDLLEELKSSVGFWLFLEIDIHDEGQGHS